LQGSENGRVATIAFDDATSFYFDGIMVIVLHPTFNNISVISWPSVLLVEETEIPGENH
jgi:hypothetical protein